MFNCLLYALGKDINEIFKKRPKTLFDIYKNINPHNVEKLILISNILIETPDDIDEIYSLLNDYINEFEKVILITLNVDKPSAHALVVERLDNDLISRDNTSISEPIRTKLSKYLNNFITILAYTKLKT